MTNATPHNSDAERHVLGAMIRNLEALHRARAILDAADLYEPRHQIIFVALCALADSRTPIDLMTLSDFLDRRGELVQSGGGFYLAELASSVVTTANVEYHSRIVLDRSQRRRIIRRCAKTIEEAESEEVAEIIQDIQIDLSRIIAGNEKAVSPVRGSIEGVIERLQERHERLNNGRLSFDGLSTNLDDLDRLTGGLRPGNQIIIAARPGEGKTSLGLQIAAHSSKTGNVLIFSYEMTADELTERLIAAESGVNLRRIMSKESASKILHAGGRIERLNLFADDSSPTMERLIQRARRMSFEMKIDLVVVDYLQLVHSQKRYENRYAAVTDFSRNLKLLAKELACPVITLSQLSRDIEKRASKGMFFDRPKLSDLKESGAIEQDADIVLFIHHPPDGDDGDDGSRELIVSKNRNGELGSVNVLFQREFTRFVPLDGEEPETRDFFRNAG